MEHAVGGDTQLGLSQAEAEARLRLFGPNELHPPRGVTVWRLAIGQLVHFFALLLWVAAVLAALAGLPVLSIAIAAVVVVNAAFAFIQEYRAERAAGRLVALVPHYATVIRDGVRHRVGAAEVVTGDLLVVTAGDQVCADAEVVGVHSLSVDTSMLTGESVPQAVDAGDNLLAGTFAVEGEGCGEVRATGADTRLAHLAQLTQATRRPPTPLARELRRLVRAIGAIALGVGGVFFAVSLFTATPPRDGFIFSLGVMVAMVPEGLLPTVTLSLALAAQRMAHENALVRRLESVETLGSTTFICTDKTGTLTRNEMSVVDVWTPEGTASVSGSGYDPQGQVRASTSASPALCRLAVAARGCSHGRVERKDGEWVAVGDPMEAAIDVFVRRLGVEPRVEPVRHSFPFDPRRRMASVVTGEDAFVKGAPDAVLPRCVAAPAGAWERLGAMTTAGLRVLAVATRRVPRDDVFERPEDVECDLGLLGLLGFEDPPRPDVADAVRACRGAGVRVAMVTGDHPQTAAAVAREVGLAAADGELLVLEGSMLPDADEELGALIDRDGVVMARVSPEHKLRIARVLQERDHVVAMTGDGVNDGPALSEADIGVAMGKHGSDVAREAADLVLLDDHFATIVTAIEHGRATYSNIRRFLTYHLTDNVAELTPFLVWALSGGRFPLVLGVIQIICIDLVTDVFPALALGVEAPHGHVLQQPPRGGRLLNRTVFVRVFGVLGPTEAVFEMVAALVVLLVVGGGLAAASPKAIAAASGAAFATVVLAQVANGFACRSTTLTPGRLGWTSNRLLIAGVATEIVLLVIAIFVGPVADVLGQTPPPASAWLVAVLAAPAVLVADAVYKRVRGARSA